VASSKRLLEEAVLRFRTIGQVEVTAIGLGCLALDNRPGALERAEGTMRAALDAGITLFDTADSYGNRELGGAAFGTNETLVGGLIAKLGVRNRVFMATKTGHVRTPDGGWDVDGSARHVRQAVDGSLRRLGACVIDLYQYHRPDPRVDYAETMGALREVYDLGKARMIGISNASAAQLEIARSILGDALASVQNEYSPRVQDPCLLRCEELGLAFLAYSPLGGIGRAGRLGQAHARFGEVAAALGVSAQRVCLAWLLARSPAMLPIPGASRPGSITDSALAADLDLPSMYLGRLGVS